MPECPDCHSKVGSLPKHRPICLVRNNKALRDALVAIEPLLKRMEDHLSAAYRAIARYTQVGPHPMEYEVAHEEFTRAVAMLKKVPPLLERIRGNMCERVAAANLNANVVSMQAAEVRDILAKLSAAKKRGT
ncbi:hypothetical protein [Haliangium sp. UPWRP_2]|uniref:hypothetical protein n=1 Tax=Haliangium sp. UPWRP_2 TaxID=1931276 RepID=UPI000D0E26B3|nr:hypothetical protein [Haliangium sp. UPWRP_2]PSM30963.1 hypothetical protein BVG81_007815 [Haliangium sp. UPWRP_2]